MPAHSSDCVGQETVYSLSIKCRKTHGDCLACPFTFCIREELNSLLKAKYTKDIAIKAVICGADLHGDDLHGADLSYADLSCANISKALLDEKEQFRKGVILKKAMRGYKKLADGSICVLSVPKGAIVFSINGSKCRTNKAKVLEGGGVSCCDNEFTYEKGKTYEIKDFDLAYNEECSAGIHFFKTRKEAEDYANN